MDAGPQLAALADPTRRAIYQMVSEAPRSVGELAESLPVTRPAVSQHLKVLIETGLVTVTARGTRRIYQGAPQGLSVLRGWLERQWEHVLDDFEAAARQEHEMNKTAIPPVVKTRTVDLDPEAAFALFTDKIDTWWPVATHSIHGDQVNSIRFEGRVGGRVVEIAEDGAEESWADVLAWDPPRRFVLSWHPNPNPIAASTLEVRFTAAPGGGTQILLEHRGWEEFGAKGTELRKDYDTGWEAVLLPFEQAAISPDS